MPNETITAEAAFRAMLEDRLAGLMLDQKEPNNPSDLQERLDDLLGELIVALSRNARIPDDSAVVGMAEKAALDTMLDGIIVEGLSR